MFLVGDMKYFLLIIKNAYSNYIYMYYINTLKKSNVELTTSVLIGIYFINSITLLSNQYMVY